MIEIIRQGNENEKVFLGNCQTDPGTVAAWLSGLPCGLLFERPVVRVQIAADAPQDNLISFLGPV